MKSMFVVGLYGMKISPFCSSFLIVGELAFFSKEFYRVFVGGSETSALKHENTQLKTHILSFTELGDSRSFSFGVLLSLPVQQSRPRTGSGTTFLVEFPKVVTRSVNTTMFEPDLGRIEVQY